MQIGETFKMKLNGQRVQAVILGPDDIIDGKTFFHNAPAFASSSLTYDQRIEKIDRAYVKKLRWFRSECIGEKVKEQNCRIYIKIISPWFN